MPSLTQMILPQFKQFGAASRSGCRVAMQLHFRLLLSVDAKLGFVWISSALIADSRSFRAVEAPCIGVPPATLTLALGFRDDVLVLVSEISCPAAEGGSFDCDGAGEVPRELGVVVPDEAAKVGICRASCVLDKPNVLGLVAFGFALPAM